MERRECLSPDDLDRPEWNSLLKNYDKHDIGEAYFQGRVEQIGLQVEHWGLDMRHEDEDLIFDKRLDLRLWEPLDGQDDKPDQWPADDFEGHLYVDEVSDGMDIPPVVKPADEPPDVRQYDEKVERTWELRGVADVKTKSNPDWLGIFNLRHLTHYAEWSDHYEVPTFIYMTMVDAEAEEIGTEDFLTPIPTDWDWELLVDHYDSDCPTNLSYGELKDTARGCDIVHRTFRAPDGNLVVETAEEEQYSWDWFTAEVLADT